MPEVDNELHNAVADLTKAAEAAIHLLKNPPARTDDPATSAAITALESGMSALSHAVAALPSVPVVPDTPEEIPAAKAAAEKKAEADKPKTTFVSPSSAGHRR